MNSYRREKLQQYIEEKEAATLKELNALFPNVSIMTIHRDLDFLEERGSILRVRGGAQAIKTAVEPKFEARENVNSNYKRIIAQKAVTLIKPGSAVFLDAGTTSLALARLMPDIDVSIFTTGPNIALELMRLSNPSINLCGGNLNRANLALSGQMTLDMMKKINIDTAFIGAGGFTFENGFTGGKDSEAKIKSLIIKKARTVVALMDSSKLTNILPFTFAGLSDFSYIINDERLPEEFIEEAKRQGVTVL